jgi:MFS family permease
MNTGRTMLTTRGMRAVADGLMSTSLTTLLLARGLPKSAVGIVSTATLLGSATTLVAITRFASRLRPYRVLLAMSLLMTATGVVFATTGSFVVLLLVSVIGPLNPSSGDVSAFLPAEQTIIGSAHDAAERTRAFARFSLVATGGAALGAFLAGPISHLGTRWKMSPGVSLNPLIYAAIGLLVMPIYVRGVGRVDQPSAVTSPTRLGPSKRVIQELTAIFALDSAGGGMVLYSIIALWMKGRFGFDLGRIGAVLGFMSLASAASALAAPKIANRIGLVETMVSTHMVANVLLIGAAFAPNSGMAVAFLIARSLLSQLDVPPRTSFVMSLVTPAERSAATAFTNLPRSIATASTPLLAASMLQHSTFGWPLVVGGAMKLAYDVLLWKRFRHRQAPRG